MTADRRNDYMEAMVDLACERGYDAVALADIAGRAGGGMAELEAVFPTEVACAVAVLEGIAESNLRVLRRAFAGEPAWPDSLRAAAYAHAEWIVENPRKMHFGLLETVWASELTAALRDHLFAEYVAMIDAGRGAAQDPGSIPAHTAEGVVGSITVVIARRLGQERGGELVDLVPEMMYLAVRPYLGEEAARHELTLSPPQAARDVAARN
ncbi:MAG TPA: TetR/AcrR family transcriptional regulator [Solirubrobacterales bacterium]|nr:TetR/AcrR family transcriptional regulator [Solirubrobacterales bacterium]